MQTVRNILAFVVLGIGMALGGIMFAGICVLLAVTVFILVAGIIVAMFK